MKIQFAIIMMLMFGRISAQTSFYFTPSVDIKTYTSSTIGQLFNSGFRFSDQVALNPYFKVNNIAMSFRSNIQIGLNLGCSLHNGRLLIAIGWNQDATGSKMESILMSYSVNKFPEDPAELKRYSDNGSTFSSTFFIQRFSLQHSVCLSRTNTSPILTYFTSSLGLFYNPSGVNKKGLPQITTTVYELSGNNQAATFLDTNIFIAKERHIVSAVNRFSANLSAGLTADFRTQIKNTYLFSVNVSFLKGFRVLESTSHEYTINDAGQNKAYSYETVSKGSGFYFLIFRRFTIDSVKRLMKTTPNKKHV